MHARPVCKMGFQKRRTAGRNQAFPRLPCSARTLLVAPSADCAHSRGGCVPQRLLGPHAGPPVAAHAGITVLDSIAQVAFAASPVNMPEPL